MLQAMPTTQDEAGQLVQEFVDIGEVWASIEPLSVRDFLNASQVAAGTTTRIVIRWHPEWHQVKRITCLRDPGKRDEVDVYEVGAGLPDDVSGREHVTYPATLRVADGWRRGEP